VAAGLLLAAIIAVPAAASAGHLLIAGGELSRENGAVYRAFIDNRPEDSPGIVIIAAASEYPTDSAARAAEALEHHGVSIDDIVAVRLAVTDDPDTADIDESSWASNVSNAEEIAKIETAGAIWFTGGDQARLSEALLDENGADTLMMAAIRIRLSRGAIIGGTSAGAAAMGDPMIVRGDPFSSLFGPIATAISQADDRAPEPLTLAPGLGLFRFALVDQHFAQRGRIARLAQAVMAQSVTRRIGLGIDEDTALLVDLAASRGEVIGTGAVTLVDGRTAELTRFSNDMLGGKMINLSHAMISRLHDGDLVALNGWVIETAPDRQEDTDNERIFGSLWPTITVAHNLETETRSLRTTLLDEAGHRSTGARLTQGKRVLRVSLRTTSDTRFWRANDDPGWAGTVIGLQLEITGFDANSDR
jgi:cyanophycinase